jgi:hypothetical protein
VSFESLLHHPKALDAEPWIITHAGASSMQHRHEVLTQHEVLIQRCQIISEDRGGGFVDGRVMAVASRNRLTLTLLYPPPPPPRLLPQRGYQFSLISPPC